MQVCQKPQSLSEYCWNEKLSKVDFFCLISFLYLNQVPVQQVNVKQVIKNGMQNSVLHLNVWIFDFRHLFPHSLELIVKLLVFAGVQKGSSDSPHCRVNEKPFVNRLQLFFLFSLKNFLVLEQKSVQDCAGCFHHHYVNNRKTMSESLNFNILKVNLTLLKNGLYQIVKDNHINLFSLFNKALHSLLRMAF